MNFRADQPDLAERLDFVTRAGASVVSFAGAPTKDAIARCHDSGVLVMPTVGARRHAPPSPGRGTGNIETDLLNGEIVLLGRLHGVPTPVNAGLQRVARRMAATGAAPGSMTPDELRDELHL